MVDIRNARTSNPVLDRALALYEDIESDHFRALEETGIAFAARDDEREESARLMRAIESRGGCVRNAGASVVDGFLSLACEACTGSCISRSFALTNNCHRDCFFCFNPNQAGFAYYCEHPFPWRNQLDELFAEDPHPEAVALTGGEPLLMPDEAVAFFARARELFPKAHLRLYTSGDLLDRALLERLRDAGLDEIRFSVKQDDSDEMLGKVLDNIALARQLVPAVMVEMPVIPGTRAFMENLLRKLDALGVDGINLLEFAYSMWNWPVFERLGLKLRNPPFRVLFDYSYAGALAVEGSEQECLELMLWAREQGLSLGLHYCSLENKHRAQVRNLNEPHAGISPCYAFDRGDFFLKTAMVFGPDCEMARERLRAAGCCDFLEDRAGESLSFHPRWLPVLEGASRSDGSPIVPCISYGVATEPTGEGDAVSIRELKVEPVSVAPPITFGD